MCVGGLFVLVCMSVWLHVCLCTTCVPGTLEGQRRVLDLLEQELQTVVSHQSYGCWEFKPGSRRAASALLLTAEPSF